MYTKGKSLLILVFCVLSAYSVQAQLKDTVILKQFASGLSGITDITHASDARLFVTERVGRIRIVKSDGSLEPIPYMNITHLVGSTGGEQGLLGLAFHPDYINNGFFYVNYTNKNGDTQISRFSVNPNNPNRADSTSELKMIFVDQPFNNHNGGDLLFGPDQYLYLGLGDGGSGGDPQGNGQKLSTMLGKILRINVDADLPYSIPIDNPFLDPGDLNLDEIWSYGWRNPWRISFDRITGDMWVGDVGQDKWEEVNFEPTGSGGGLNYGWRCKEAFENFNTSGCPGDSAFIPPVLAYLNPPGQPCASVTGGYVYRGTEAPSLYGQYIYSDYCNGKIWGLAKEDTTWVNNELTTAALFQMSTFGENYDGELFVGYLTNGTIWQVLDRCQLMKTEIHSNNDTVSCCPMPCKGALSISASGVSTPYTWELSNGNSGTFDDNALINNLCGGNYTITITSAEGCKHVLNNEILTIVDTIFPLVILNQSGDSLCGPGNLKKMWYKNGILIAEDSMCIHLLDTGLYQLTLIYFNTCCVKQLYYFVTSTSSVNELYGFLTVYPNPAIHQIQLMNSSINPYSCKLFDIHGRVVYTGKVEAKEHLIIPDINPGMYQLECIHGKEIIVIPVEVIQR